MRATGVGARAAIPTPMLALLLFGWLASSAWLRPLALPDEGRYVGVAYEMLSSGDWLVPTLDGLPYFHKPPLFYWLTAASLALFGINEFAARLPSLLAATGSALTVFWFMRRWTGGAPARLTLLILATTPFFFGGAQFANLDMLVAALIGCTVLTAADAVLAAEEGRPRRQTLLAAYALAALAVLAKGLIGVAIPVLVVGTWLVCTGRPAMMLRLVSAPGAALFALIVVPWFALIAHRYPLFLHYFFVHHHFERYTSGDFNGRQPFWFYLPVLAGFTLPWFVFLPRALRPIRAASAPEDAVAGRVVALMWSWLIATLLFFSIPQSKLIGYVLVAVPPMAVLCAHGLGQYAGAGIDLRRWTARLAALAVGICAVVLTGTTYYERHNVRQLLVGIRPLLGAGDRIIALHGYPFSLPFYLRLGAPLGVVEDWDRPQLLRKDNWRKELSEAAAFADPALAHAILLTPAQLARHLACAHDHALFLIADERLAAGYPEVARLPRVASLGRYGVWQSRPVGTVAAAAACGT